MHSAIKHSLKNRGDSVQPKEKEKVIVGSSNTIQRKVQIRCQPEKIIKCYLTV